VLSEAGEYYICQRGGIDDDERKRFYIDRAAGGDSDHRDIGGDTAAGAGAGAFNDVNGQFHPEVFGAGAYVYYGWMIEDEDQGAGLLDGWLMPRLGSNIPDSNPGGLFQRMWFPLDSHPNGNDHPDNDSDLSADDLSTHARLYTLPDGGGNGGSAASLRTSAMSQEPLIEFGILVRLGP
jgi:hypothetical protein